MKLELFCVAATLAKGDLLIKNFDPKLIKTELNLLKKVGAKIKLFKNSIHVKGPEKIKSIRNITTKEYPGFPTDLAPQFMVLLCKASGTSSITENIFQGRFLHAMELQRLRAKITIKNRTAKMRQYKLYSSRSNVKRSKSISCFSACWYRFER